MRYFFVFITLAGATICYAQNSNRDVSYWVMPENKEALNKIIEKCNNNPAKYASNADCINAKEAKKKIFKQNFLNK